MRLSDRVSTLAPEGAYTVLERATELEASGKRIIHLEIGQPDFPTPSNISEAGIRAIRDNCTRYTSPSGIQSLRNAIADHAGRLREMVFDPNQVIVSPGAKPNLFFPTLAIIEPGDEVLYPDPGFPSYCAMIEVAGGVPVPVPLDEENNFSIDLSEFDNLIGDRTRLIILNSPANPTGGVIPLKDLEHIAKAAQEYNCWVMSDEIYFSLVFDGKVAPTIASLPGMMERTIIIDGFSKTYSMTGWRLGFGIMPVSLADKVGLLLTHSVGCTADFTQHAGLEALSGSQDNVDIVRAEYQRRRDLIVKGLNRISGVSCNRPDGAFYVFPNVKSFGHSSEMMAKYLLEEAGVAVLPGNAFGANGEGYLRLTFSNSIENIEQALDKMAKALKRLS